MDAATQTNRVMERKPKTTFVQGAIAPPFIADSIAKHNSKTNIGAHSIFLGQVRADAIDEKKVAAIEYTTYEELALEKMHLIREEIFSRYELTCMHVYHSLGTVAAGEICLFVFTSSTHRRAAIDACNEVVERIKTELPVWGRELFPAGPNGEDEKHQWKVNQ
jgi:molybdopterin synthase catalytic subunit